MEILKGYKDSVRFAVPADLAIANFKVLRDGTQIGTDAPATVSGGIATVDLPYAAVFNPGEIDVVLMFSADANQYELKQTVNVVTPILAKHEILDIFAPEVPDDTEVVNIEAAVRHVIETYTGQKFDYFVGVKTVWGRGDPYLTLPRRLESVTAINDTTIDYLPLDIRNNGWTLIPRGTQEVKWKERGEYYPITNPYSGKLFASNQSYNINGTWGWSSVPDPVREAAKLLINDYTCLEQAYRDRYLVSMTSADWRIQYSPSAYADTGNARANLLLAPYQVTRIAVV